ncbi:MAG: YchJ family metal-binding protein [Verrucomicrobia bacterium]|nr:YchJ family metal-binding protein [Verrucomicrobiota bacterium]MDA1006843.1 YchJ family metal-binding protein [Verrucomicrobiota bacterium]
MHADEKIPREREAGPCPCGSGVAYDSCCMPFHYGHAKPKTAGQLMRSRYSAYFFRLTDYLVDSTHPDTKTPKLKAEYEANIHQLNWRYLKILNTSKGGPDDKVGKVEFTAGYSDGTKPQELHERSRFKRFKGAWKYLDAKG